jgi:hypothetical protein
LYRIGFGSSEKSRTELAVEASSVTASVNLNFDIQEGERYEARSKLVVGTRQEKKKKKTRLDESDDL